jgi:NAD+ synthase
MMPGDDRTDYAALADEIASWLRSHMKAAHASRLVLGLSGGIDSAVVCALCTMAAGPFRVIPAIMPIHSRDADVRDAELVARTYEVIPRLIDLAPAYDALLAALPEDGASGLEDANVDPEARDRQRSLAHANIKPRLRMTTLYALANRYNGVVVGTGNKTELSIGYFTKYGDGGVDLLPIGDLDKTAVRALALGLGVPEPVISKPPSAGLWDGQIDEVEIGLSYAQLDRVLSDIASGAASRADSANFDRVASLIAASEHKRVPIPVFRRDETTRGES